MAGVPVVEFLNPFCPHCRATHQRLERVLASGAPAVRRFRVYVWSTASAPLWAQACASAAASGREDALFAELLRAPRDTPEAVWAAARRAGIDVEALVASLRRGDAMPRLDAERRRVLASSIAQLPTIDVGRMRLQGEQSEAELRGAIERAAAVIAPRPTPPSRR